jgi:hypothetical protein
MMGEIGSALGGMIVPFTIVVNMPTMNILIVNMQGQHAPMDLVQDMNDGRAVGTRKRNRRAKDTKRIGGNQQSCPQTP